MQDLCFQSSGRSAGSFSTIGGQRFSSSNSQFTTCHEVFKLKKGPGYLTTRVNHCDNLGPVRSPVRCFQRNYARANSCRSTKVRSSIDATLPPWMTKADTPVNFSGISSYIIGRGIPSRGDRQAPSNLGYFIPSKLCRKNPTML
jgi:hypothetical protein